MCVPATFQNKIPTLMEGLEFARTCLDDLLCLSRGFFTKHILDVEQVLVKLSNANIKVSAAKPSLGKTEID